MAELEQDVKTLAKLAGLDIALKDFPEDVQIALEDARRYMGNLPSDLQPADEPWPPMQVSERL